MPDSPLICLVEDDDGVRLALHLLLRSHGWRCQPFASAEEFLAAPQVASCNCLITDLNMVGMNGAELVEELRLRDSRVPVVAITADPDSKLVKRARRCGISALLIKPFQGGALLMAVHAAIAANN